MPGFDGLENAKQILNKMMAEKKERDKAEELQKQKEARIMRGEITLDDLEEYYQDIKSRVSPAYFSGSAFNVGDSFKTWYLNTKHAKDNLASGFLLSAVLSKTQKDL